MRLTSDFDNQVLIQKSKRESLIQGFLSESTDNEKETFFKNFLDLHLLIHHYLIESNRFTVILDTNVIQDIQSSESNRGREVRYIATSALLCFLEDYAHANVWLGVTPAVLYELNGQQPIASMAEYNKAMGTVEQVAIKLGISTYTIAFHSYADLRRVSKSLHSDAKRIKNAVTKLASQSWQMDFEQEGGRIAIPMAIAEQSIPNIKLDYLDPFYVKWALMNFVEKRMFEQNKHQRKARKMMSNGQKGISKLFKINSKGALMGLADIELLSKADLTAQSALNSPLITSAITYDKALLETLYERMGTMRDGGKFESGKDNPSDAAGLFVYQMKISEARTKHINERSKVYAEALSKFSEINFKSVESSATSQKE